MHYAYFRNLNNGHLIYIDLFKNRLLKLQHSIFAWAQVFQDYQKQNPLSFVMVGLTYAPTFTPTPNDIRTYIKKIKRQLGSDLKGFAWVAELQSRGVLHYHVIFAIEPSAYLARPDSGQWPFGSSNIKRARTPFYLASYTSKKYQKDFSKFPDGFRAYSVSCRLSQVNFKAIVAYPKKPKQYCECGEPFHQYHFSGSSDKLKTQFTKQDGGTPAGPPRGSPVARGCYHFQKFEKVL